MSEKRSKKTETKRKAAKRRRRSLALSVMVGILLAGVENCLFLPYGSNYAAESEKRLSVSEGQVGCETEMESELKWNLEPESESEYCLEAESESESEAES
ncbi:MAG: hypothetical protein LUF27_12510, partial [Lachnospiraceae bacterium]|nr:hypothetical protein [Lachnospiraceae bacterium]